MTDPVVDRTVAGVVVDPDDQRREALLDASEADDFTQALEDAIDAACLLGDTTELAECYRHGGDP